MKRTIFALSALVFALSNTACSEDGLDDKSVITGIGYEIETPFDEWLLENFIEPYNIRVMYRYEDMESDMTYNLVPARYERSIEMAQLVSYLCLQAYDEITGSRDFIRANFPKDLFFVGSPAYTNNGSIVLGTAEGGTKITLYNLNTLDPRNVDALNSSYFKTIHHEFGHILNQKKPYTSDFEQIVGKSDGGIRYVGNSCWEVYPTETSALQDGFISRYASTSDGEEFVELASIYVTNTPEAWETKLRTAGARRSMIEQKFDIVYKYYENDWGIDLEKLREIVLRRQQDVPTLDLDI